MAGSTEAPAGASAGAPTGPGRRPLGATGLAARSLAPDLARGAMLLLIALANAHLYLYGHAIGIRGYPVLESVPDQLVALVQLILVDGRAYPMFALLFGYGIVQLLRRHTGGGVDAPTVRRLVRRRGWWLMLFGLGHALLLFSGDILGSYGLLAVMLAGLLIRASDRTLLVLAGCWTLPVVVIGALQGVPAPDGAESALPSMVTTDPLVAAQFRVVEWMSLTVLVAVLGLVPALLLGVWAARRRLLDEPQRHLRLLRRAAVLGPVLAAVGGLPLALMGATWWAQWWGQPSEAAVLLAAAVHTLTGYAGGVGYAAIAGLIAVRVAQRRGPVVSALAACGQRSLTCYLLQSVVFVAVLAAYGGGLGDRFGVAATALVATGTWALTVVLAAAMHRRGHRGPAEVLLRRLTYGSR
jgi:uncharacterized protein